MECTKTKVVVIGKEYVSGISRRNGMPFESNVAHVAFKKKGVKGQSADSIWLNPNDYPLSGIQVGKTYDVDRDSRGFLLSFDLDGINFSDTFEEDGRIEGAIQDGCHWLIPKNALKPKRIKTGPKIKPIDETTPPKLLTKLIHQRDGHNYSGLYDYSQVNLAYSSCRMASGRLTRE